MNYLVNFVWGNNMQIVDNSNKEILKVVIQKKDLKKIIELDLDLTGEIKQIYDANANLNLDDYIEITSLDLKSFLIQQEWIIDEEEYDKFSLTELEIVLEKVYNMILNKPTEGLYISNDMWREMYDFSEDAVLLVLASEIYDENDYIRDYQKFIQFVDEKRGDIK